MDRRYFGCGPLYDKSQSQVSDKSGLCQCAHCYDAQRLARWLWSWAFAIPQKAKQPEAAQRFAEWATSKDYIKLVVEDARLLSVDSSFLPR